MNNLEFFLDNYNNKEINFDLKNQYKVFGYDDEDLFITDLEFMLENFYDIKFIENKKLIQNLEPTFQKIETLQNEMREAETLYKQLIKELSEEALPNNKNVSSIKTNNNSKKVMIFQKKK